MSGIRLDFLQCLAGYYLKIIILGISITGISNLCVHRQIEFVTVNQSS